MSAATFFQAIGLSPDDALLSELAERSAAVEDVLTEVVRSQVQLADQVNTHTLRAGGKRLRPALVHLCAAACGPTYDPRRVDRLGACLEMVHMATLLHDDVVDEADSRRGRPTASVLFGNTAGILSGDVLLARAMEILAIDGDLRIIRLVSRAVVEMAEGEVLELQHRGEFDLAVEEHLRVLDLKTAAFIRCCCQVGALAAGASDAVIEALGVYGSHVGLAFQIADDTLDYAGSQTKTGKPRATDFREGCATLPLLLLRPRLDDAEVAFVRGKFGNGVTDEDLDMIMGWMDTRGALAATRQEAACRAESATDALALLPASPHRQVLHALARYVVEREA